MENARKMVLLPEESVGKLQIPYTNQHYEQNYQQLNGQRVLSTSQTPGTHLKRLDDDMSHILNSEALSDRDKWTQYQQLLQRYLGAQHHTSKKPIEQVIQDEDKKKRGIDNDKIISTVPVTMKRKSELLLQFLENDDIKDRITWDSRGEVTIDGKKITSSNIIDLVNDIIRTRKRTQSVGREHFSWFLRDSAVPLEYIGNHDLYNAGANFLRSKKAAAVEKINQNTPRWHNRFSSTPKSLKKISPKLSFKTSDDEDDDDVYASINNTIIQNKSQEKGNKSKKKNSFNTSGNFKNQNGRGSGWMTFSL